MSLIDNCLQIITSVMQSNATLGCFERKLDELSYLVIVKASHQVQTFNYNAN